MRSRWLDLVKHVRIIEVLVAIRIKRPRIQSMDQAGRLGPLQPEDRSQLSSQAEFPVLLGLHLSALGQPVSG